MNGAQALIKTLEALGVEIVFGYPGGAVLAIYDALLDSKIKHVLTRGEQAAAHAASGYARSTGKVGVCLGTSGPGATNLVTGIANAYLDSTPIVAITGQVDSRLIGQDVFQEVDIVGATAPFTKNNYFVSDADDIMRIVSEAFHIASTGRPGPVLIDFPSDYQKQAVDYSLTNEVHLRGYKPNNEPNSRQLKKIEEAIQSCSKHLVCVGGGCMLSGASDLVLELVERIHAPFVTTLPGVGSVPTEHPRCLGMIGQSGLYAANQAVSKADLLIVLGARLGDRATGQRDHFSRNANIIHIDIDPAEIGKRHKAFLSVVGDLRLTLQQLLKMKIDRSDSSEWEKEYMKWQVHQDITGATGINDLDPKDIMVCLSEKSGADVILTTDVGQNQIWAGRYYKTKVAGSFITSAGLGTMGFSIPSAIGAALAHPEKRVLTIVGDGGFQMCLNELATIRQENLHIGIMLLNNQCLGMVRELQQHYCKARYSQVKLIGNPDFYHIAAAYGFEYLKVTRQNEIEVAIDMLLDPQRSIIVEFAIDASANVVPIKTLEESK